MASDVTALVLGLVFAALVSTLIRVTAGRLQKFPKTRKRGAFWYKWRSEPNERAISFAPTTGIRQCLPTFQAKAAWLLYIAHQLFSWGILYWQQRALSKNGFAVRVDGWCSNPGAADSGAGEGEWCGFGSSVAASHVVALVGNGVFILLHVLKTHTSYDGLALDVSEASSQISVILLLVFVLFMENESRGLWFTGSLPVAPTLSAFARKYHGYFFNWATVYTLHYHPAEATSGDSVH